MSPDVLFTEPALKARGAGYAYQVSGSLLKGEFEQHGKMQHLLLRYTQAFITRTARTADSSKSLHSELHRQ